MTYLVEEGAAQHDCKRGDEQQACYSSLEILQTKITAKDKGFDIIDATRKCCNHEADCHPFTYRNEYTEVGYGKRQGQQAGLGACQNPEGQKTDRDHDGLKINCHNRHISYGARGGTSGSGNYCPASMQNMTISDSLLSIAQSFARGINGQRIYLAQTG